jgi:hypothetical protein
MFLKFGFAVFERRTVCTTIADCPQFIFQQRTKSVPVTILHRVLPPDSLLVLRRQSAAVSSAQVKMVSCLCVFATLTGGQSVAHPRTVCHLNPDSPRVHKKCCFLSCFGGSFPSVLECSKVLLGHP